MSKSFLYRAASTLAAQSTYTFAIRIVDENGKQGSYTKSVTANNAPAAWAELIRNLRVSGTLQYVVQLDLSKVIT